jgi:hypothetical protein
MANFLKFVAIGYEEIYGYLNPGDQLLKTATDEIRNGSKLAGIKTVSL